MGHNRNEKTPTVLNLIMLGTDYHHLNPKQRHVLTDLSSAIETGPNQSVHLIDGVGGEPDANHPQAAEHPMLGDYDFQVKYNLTSGNITSQKTHRKTFYGTNSITGRLAGKGYQDAITEAIQVINCLQHAGKTPLIINMYGYSRGADTALRIANILHSLYKPSEVKVNIFAIDPVAGVGRRQANKAQLIPNNVEEYQSIFMQDENRPGFEPQDKRRLKVQDPEATTVTHKIYAGNHGTPLRLQTDLNITPETNKYLASTIDTTRMVWDDLHKFAWRNGTLLKFMPYLLRNKADGKHTWKQFDFAPLTEPERLAAYTRMAINKEIFAKHSPVRSDMHKREVIKYKYNYILHGQNYFQDKNHRELFYQHYPSFFDYYFQRNLGGVTPAKVFEDIQKLQNQPDIMNSLRLAGLDITGVSNPDQLGNTNGIHLTLTDLQGKLGTLWEKILAITNPVLTGLDDSISTEVAQGLLDDVLKTMLSDQDANAKIKIITAKIAQTVASAGPQKMYIERLSTLLPQDEKHEAKDPYSRRLAQSLNQHFSGIKIFENKTLAKGQKKIVAHLIDTLKKIEALGMGNDNTVLSQVLTLALHRSKQLDIDNGMKIAKESPFDKLLRKELIQISGFSTSPKESREAKSVQEIIANLENDLTEAVSPASPTSPKELKT